MLIMMGGNCGDNDGNNGGSSDDNDVSELK